MSEVVKLAGSSDPASTLLGERTKSASKGIHMPRRWTRPTVQPLDEITWELRSATIGNEKGEVVFEQHDVEVPTFWSQLATNVVVSKYFRGTLGTPQRERSVKQLVGRVANTIADWGINDGYFASSEDAEAFRAELTYLLVNQYTAFNSPVWFNVGIEKKPQCSACFILSVDDTMESILEWYRNEGMIFKYGSGAGLNVSPIRSGRERLAGGGTASGPVSFMRAADASAGVIKSGGKTRRAAKMVVLNADHPDVKPFIVCKWKEEEKAHKLMELGYDPTIDGEAYSSVFFQNANNSVRATDDFMKLALSDEEWELHAVTTGEVIERVKARDLLRLIAEATWHCGDPGMQFDTTINDWHTCPNTGRINASNPCFTGDARVYTDKGLIPFKELHERAQLGETFRVFTHDATNPDRAATVSVTKSLHIMCTGPNEVYRLRFANGTEVKATANHRFFTENRGMVAAKDLRSEDEVQLLDQPVELLSASLTIDLDDAAIFQSGWGGRDTKTHQPVQLPRTWTAPLAEYLGFLVGDGSIVEATDAEDRLSTASMVFGNPMEAGELLPRFESLVAEWGITQPQTVTMPNGTVQFRVNRTPIVRFLKQLGMKESKAPEKQAPRTIFQTPTHIIAAFLRGLFTADGCVYNGQKSRYVGLSSASRQLLADVQQLLLVFGLQSRIYRITEAGRGSFAYTKRDGSPTEYASHTLYDLRIAGPSITRFREHVGFLTIAKQEKLDRLIVEHRFYRESPTTRILEMAPLGQELTYNLTEPKNHSYIVNGFVVANCSEYMHLDNSACNLASINLMKFIDNEGNFLVEQFKYAVRVMTIAQDIIVDNSSYPTQKIDRNARDYRELGLGYANLGALLMSLGLAYDSEEGRAWAGAISALMCGQASEVSGEIAQQLGPYAGFMRNRDPQLRVLRKHRAAVDRINSRLVPQPVLQAAARAWDASIELGERFGVRNSQMTVIAPTGTIAFMMDCDTTGIEPDIALIKYKRLVGGGMLKIVNQTVPRALQRLGYDGATSEQILKFLNEQETIEGAPGLKEEHLSVFDCAFRARSGKRSIHYMGHIRMMAAVQPFISGAISKTVNLPPDATVEDIMRAYTEAWRLGLKAIAIYRDGSKGVQPLSTSKDDKKPGAKAPVGTPYRRHLADERQAITHKFSIGGHEGYITVGLFEDGTPGEIFITMSKEGSTLSGLMDSFATMVSLALQYGVPIKVLVGKFSHMRFEPSGVTNNKDIRFAKSVIDYIFRWLALKFLPGEQAQQFKVTELPGAKPAAEPVATAPVKAPADNGQPHANPFEEQEKLTFVAQADAPACHECGSLMVRNGNCYKCGNCGSTSGCS